MKDIAFSVSGCSAVFSVSGSTGVLAGSTGVLAGSTGPSTGATSA